MHWSGSICVIISLTNTIKKIKFGETNLATGTYAPIAKMIWQQFS